MLSKHCCATRLGRTKSIAFILLLLHPAVDNHEDISVGIAQLVVEAADNNPGT